MFAYCLNNPANYVDPFGYLGLVNDITNPKALLLTREHLGDDTLPDITEKLNKAMVAHAEELETYYKTYGGVAAALFFAEKVRGGGEWDLKSQPEWGLSEGNYYLYCGKTVYFDDPGNIHYGFVGRVLFSEEVLLVAGGMVQIISGTSSWSFWESHFDDPRDQYAISWGFNLWEEGFK